MLLIFKLEYETFHPSPHIQYAVGTHHRLAKTFRRRMVFRIASTKYEFTYDQDTSFTQNYRPLPESSLFLLTDFESTFSSIESSDIEQSNPENQAINI